MGTRWNACDPIRENRDGLVHCAVQSGNIFVYETHYESATELRNGVSTRVRVHRIKLVTI